ncbi:unnamed protein product [Knipowitschia caucasica]
MDKVDIYEVMKATEEVETLCNQTDGPPKKRRGRTPHQTCNLEKPKKKPRSAYLLYYFDIYQVMQREVPNLPQSEINKRISESWRKLSVAKKSYYIEKAKSEKEGPYSPLPNLSSELPGFRRILPRGGEAEPYPQAEESAEEVVSKPRRILPYPSFTVLSNTESSLSSVSGSKAHEEKPQVVALIPTQNLLGQSSLSAVTPVGSVMVMPSLEQNPKPPYTMPVKTYTRRGRGKCSNPDCSFIYVTRHKPPKCPECGQYLGGKWIPVDKKGKSNKNKSSNSDNKPKETTIEMKQSGADKEVTKTKRKKRQQASTNGQQSPLEGSSNNDQTIIPGVILHTGPKDGNTSQDKLLLQIKPVRRILPAFYSKNNEMFKLMTVLHNKVENANSTVIQQSLAGLKPSTLKQLGQITPTNSDKQISPTSVEAPPPVASLDHKVNLVSVVPSKPHTATNFNLGLATARGRGWCKNPACTFMYKNRHKPAVCPKCGSSLNQKDNKGIKPDTLLDPYKNLTPSQKDLQRQSTILLVQRTLQFAESEADLQETLDLIHELNNLQIVVVQHSDPGPEENVETETLFESGWPHLFESASTHCHLCNYPLFKGGLKSVAGQVECWLLTETLMQTVSLQLKICLNLQCLALYSFTDLHAGLFNIGNKLLVTMDLFLKIRANLKVVQNPSQVLESILDHVPGHPIHTLTPGELGHIQELLQCGYWAFECLTVRDYNDMICGICGLAPKIEVAQRHKSTLALENVEFIWPESSDSDEVLVDDFWLTMESEALEQAMFLSFAHIIRVDASIIAPFIPPLMRSATVMNTEKYKIQIDAASDTAEPSVLVRLIHDGHLRLEKLEEHSDEELRAVLQKCGGCVTHEMTKSDLMVSLLSLYTRVHNGLPSAPEPCPLFTAGKLTKVCPHKVVSVSKCLIRRESARDHIDLLLSSRYWPPVYVSDCAQQVALCADLQYPDLATQMWGRNQGCFCDPFEKPEFVSCAELLPQTQSPDFDETPHVHPVTSSVSRWLVHPPEDPNPEGPPPPKHHSPLLCQELQPDLELLRELKPIKDNPEDTEKPVVFKNTPHYYLYNRLLDFLTSRDIVNQQVTQVLQSCQPGEVVIRDSLYRLGVAKIDTEKEEEVIEAVTVEPIVQT